MATWYFKYTEDNLWVNPNNWWSNSDGTGSHPAAAPWTTDSATLNADNLSLAPGAPGDSGVVIPIIDGTIGNSEWTNQITGECDIGGVQNQGVINGGTFSGAEFFNGGTINGGTFSGADFASSGDIWGGIFSGDGFTNWGGGVVGIWGGNFSGAGFTNSGTINGGIFSGDGFINNSSIYNGVFSGDGFINNYEISGGEFSGAGFTNNSSIWGGNFSGDGFESNSGTINGGTFSGMAVVSVLRNGLTFSTGSGTIILQNQSAGVLDVLGTGLQ